MNILFITEFMILMIVGALQNGLDTNIYGIGVFVLNHMSIFLGI